MIIVWVILLCAECLSTLINKAENEGEIKGMQVTRGGTKLTHLLFADDSIIFGRASLNGWRRLSKLLDMYEQASRQCLKQVKNIDIFQLKYKGKREKRDN